MSLNLARTIEHDTATTNYNHYDTIRILIVDDEPLARRAMRRAISENRGVEIVGEGANGDEAIKLISQKRPDLIFLDIEMPGIDGLDMIRKIKADLCPFIVFVTAYDKYALDAFKVRAVDYILKPINEENIKQVIERIKIRKKERDSINVEMKLNEIIEMLNQKEDEVKGSSTIDRFTIKNNGKIFFIETSAIDWIQAEGNYVALHTGINKHLIRIKMNQIENRLNGEEFIRIHRSVIVNVKSIIELHPCFDGTYLFLLKNNSKVYSSRGYRKNVEYIINRIN